MLLVAGVINFVFPLTSKENVTKFPFIVISQVNIFISELYDTYHPAYIPTYEEIDAMPYTPSFIQDQPRTQPSRDSTSSTVPHYVYSNIKHATENCKEPKVSNTYGHRARKILDNYIDSYDNSLEDLSVSFKQENIERHMSEYQIKVSKEKQSKEQLINELLAENERITEWLKQKVKKKPEEKKFVIPELPNGRVMVIDILSTWGDKHYVGLNGIEVFGSDGKVVSVKMVRSGFQTHF